MLKSLFSGATKSYSPRNVIVTAGFTLITQWEKLTVAYDKNAFSLIAGAYGKVVKKRTMNPLGTITLVLPQTGNANAYLAAQRTIANLSYTTNLAITITDLWGGSLHFMSSGTILKVPDISYSKDPESRAWVVKGVMDLSVLNAMDIIQSL